MINDDDKFLGRETKIYRFFELVNDVRALDFARTTTAVLQNAPLSERSHSHQEKCHSRPVPRDVVLGTRTGLPKS